MFSSIAEIKFNVQHIVCRLLWSRLEDCFISLYTMNTLASYLGPFCACVVKCFMGAGEVLSPLVAFNGKGTRFHYITCPVTSTIQQD